jgi:hypothetical protein
MPASTDEEIAEPLSQMSCRYPEPLQLRNLERHEYECYEVVAFF